MTIVKVTKKYINVKIIIQLWPSYSDYNIIVTDYKTSHCGDPGTPEVVTGTTANVFEATNVTVTISGWYGQTVQTTHTQCSGPQIGGQS